jgi:cysteine desulfurase
VPKSNLQTLRKNKEIYLDHASGALRDEANPSSIHSLGVKERSKLENARKTVARILGALPDEIIFTSGATESNNLAILNFKNVITTNIEHASVLEPAKHAQGKAVFLEVGTNGILNTKELRKALRKDTELVSVMYANNEIGTIEPIKEIAKEIRHFNKLNGTKIIFHTDATQAMSYLPVNVEQLGVDLMSFNAAKIYGPKGVGVLFKRRKINLKPIMYGGGQEFGLRPGTENVAGAVAIAKALEYTEKIKAKEVKRLISLRDYFLNKLEKLDPKIILNGDLENRLPNNVNITILNIPSDLLVIELSAHGIMASAKSSCKAGDGKDSYVILALRKEDGLSAKALATAGSLRFSLGRSTTKADIDHTVKALSDILTKLKRWYY